MTKHSDHISSHRHHQMSTRNVGSVCSYGTNFSAYFRQGDPLLSSVMTSARICEWHFFWVFWYAILIVSAHWSVYKAEVLIHSITNSVWCEKFDGINQKDVKLISQLVDSNTSTFMTNPIIMFHISVHSAGGRHHEYSASLTDVIPFLDSADQSNTTICLIASSLKANVNIWKVSAPILQIWNNNLTYMHCSLKCVIFWRNKNCTGHSTWSHFIAMHATTVKSTTNDHADSTPLPHRWWVLYKLQ